jgi:predicted amidohydrolase
MKILALLGVALAAQAQGPAARTVRVCATQPASRLVDWRLGPQEALAAARRSLDEFVRMVDRAGAAGCDVLAFPEDTLGTLHWEVGNPDARKTVLPAAVSEMLQRLGAAAAKHRMYVVCSNDTFDDGGFRNTAFFLGRDGREIGRYHKVQPTVNESDRRRGTGFPVYETPDLGGVGMAICYDMVMPETVRSLALNGADVVFNPTLGGAIFGDAELNRAAFRVRAAENFVYLVVSKRGGGAMVVSPKGKILSEGKAPDEIVMADIDPFGGRDAGDALNSQADMRARLYRERNPAAYGVLAEPHPPALKKIPQTITVEEAVRIGGATLTVGNERFSAADSLLKAGKTAEAEAAFEKLRAEFPHTWIDRQARDRLSNIRAGK